MNKSEVKNNFKNKIHERSQTKVYETEILTFLYKNFMPYFLQFFNKIALHLTEARKSITQLTHTYSWSS